MVFLDVILCSLVDRYWRFCGMLVYINRHTWRCTIEGSNHKCKKYFIMSSMPVVRFSTHSDFLPLHNNTTDKGPSKPLIQSGFSSGVKIFFFNSGLWGYWHCGHSWPIVPASGDSKDDCGEADGMKIGRGNRSSRRKPAPVPLLSITKSNMPRPGFEPGPPRWEAGD
jgi:hypothetical protein